LTKYTPKTAGKFAFNAVLDKQVLSPQPFIITVSEVVPSVTVLTKLPSEVIGFFFPSILLLFYLVFPSRS